jgi:hypothetical protein
MADAINPCWPDAEHLGLIIAQAVGTQMLKAGLPSVIVNARGHMVGMDLSLAARAWWTEVGKAVLENLTGEGFMPSGHQQPEIDWEHIADSFARALQPATRLIESAYFDGRMVKGDVEEYYYWIRDALKSTDFDCGDVDESLTNLLERTT